MNNLTFKLGFVSVPAIDFHLFLSSFIAITLRISADTARLSTRIP